MQVSMGLLQGFSPNRPRLAVIVFSSREVSAVEASQVDIVLQKTRVTLEGLREAVCGFFQQGIQSIFR